MKTAKTAASLAILLLIAGLILYRTLSHESWRAPRVVTFATESELVASPYAYWVSDAQEGSPQALLLRESDLVGGGSDAQYRYRPEDGDALDMKFDDWSIRLNKNVIALDLGHEEGLAWIQRTSDDDILRLRALALPDEPDAQELAALNRVAAVNPAIDLNVESATALKQALQLFRPHTLLAAVDSDEGEWQKEVARQPQIETLYLRISESSQAPSFDFLQSLPSLKRLSITLDESKKIVLTGKLPRLESLVLGGEALPDFGSLAGAAENLSELALYSSETIDLSGIDRLSRLTILAVGPESKSPDLSALAALHRLRWFQAPTDMTQQQFEVLVKEHPGLEILQLSNDDAKLDLAPLRGLSRLSALILLGSYDNLEVIGELKSLGYVGVSKHVLADSPAEVARIRQLLPDAVIVRVSPVCLGSGWIFLLIPALAFAWTRRRLRNSMPAAA